MSQRSPVRTPVPTPDAAGTTAGRWLVTKSGYAADSAAQVTYLTAVRDEIDAALRAQLAMLPPRSLVAGWFARFRGVQAVRP